MVFYEKNTGDDAIRIVWDLLKQSREERRKTVIPDLEIIAELSLFLPARVIVYLTAEIKHLGFWETWKELHENIYHDEFMKQYASKELLNERKKRIEAPIPPLRTSDFLRQDNWFTFWDTPEEALKKPKYYISDDDRLYWWDGSDEVTISHETDMWLRTLANDHRKIMAQFSDTPVDSDTFLKEFFLLLVRTDQYYKRILPFQSMFYEFIENGSRKEYKAAVKLFKKISDENRKEGEIIKYVNLSWNLASRKVTHNVGRIRLKRYLSVMANRTLRKKYFGF